MLAMNLFEAVILRRLNFRYSEERTERSYRTEKEIPVLEPESSCRFNWWENYESLTQIPAVFIVNLR
jgi:hypothetical protein